jgi:hypothetical protein
MFNDSWAGRNPARVVVPIEEEEDIQLLLFSVCDIVNLWGSLFAADIFWFFAQSWLNRSTLLVLEKKSGFCLFFRNQGNNDLCQSRCPLTRFRLIAFCIVWTRRVDASTV